MNTNENKNQEKNDDFDLDDIVAKLKTWRDELKLQAHLFKAEAKDEWDVLEKKMENLVNSAKRIDPETTETVSKLASETKKNVEHLSQQLLERYAKFKESFKEKSK